MGISEIRAANRDVPACEPGPLQDCSDILHLAFYFDGTGNNRDADAAQKKWSNVARLFDASREDNLKGIYRAYTSGIGTKLNRREAAASTPWRWLRDNDKLGGGIGLGASSRLEKGKDDLTTQLQQALLINARKAGGELKTFAQKNEAESFSKLNQALGSHRLIKIINISVFGFSRGASLARAFTNKLIGLCKPDAGGQLTLHGYPVRFVFLGVFDTVASFGLPAANGVLPWGGVDLKVSEHVERCVHYVAGHELRYAFPVDLVRENGQCKSNCHETVYPGVHSDVGGGYAPDEQARRDHLARIPLRDMLAEARNCGVRIFALKELEETNFPIFQRLNPDPDVASAYQTYRAQCGAGGSIEVQIQRHMELFYSYHGTLKRRGGKAPSLTAQNAALDQAKRELDAARAEVNKALEAMQTLSYDELTQQPRRNKADADRYTAAVARERAASERYGQLKTESENLSGGMEDIHQEAAYLIRRRDQNRSLRALAWSDRVRSWQWDVNPEAWMLEAYERGGVTDDIIQFFERYVHDSKAGFELQGSVEPFSYFRRRGVHEQLRPVVSDAEGVRRLREQDEARQRARQKDRARAGIYDYRT